MEITYDQNPPDKDPGPTILIVDDEALGRERLQLALDSLGHQHQTISRNNISEAMDVLARTRVHVLLLDKNLGPDESESVQNGIEMIPELLQLQPHMKILVITGSKDTQDVVTAMKNGAFGYVTKETDDRIVVEQIKAAIRGAELEIVQARSKKDAQVFTIGSSSFSSQKLLAQIRAVAETSRPVLLLGETGTGKTTTARLIHEYREAYLKQTNRPFIEMNLSALAPTLIESELFGSERGAFTGATETKQGFFELANAGTLFLDEIGEISLDTQKKLLTVLENGVFYRLGGKKPHHSSFKLICATNRNLKAMVAEGHFREDLYMRISTFSVEVPSLSERREEIPELIRLLLPNCCKENNVFVSFEELPADFIEYLANNLPPGNIRGLEQQLSRLLVFAPKDKNKRPIFKRWRNVPGLLRKRNEIAGSGYSTLLEPSTEILGNGFPGLPEFLRRLETKILLEAKRTFKTNREIASRLHIAEPTVSVKLSKLVSSSGLSEHKLTLKKKGNESKGYNTNERRAEQSPSA